jgi:hypothetical protein
MHEESGNMCGIWRLTADLFVCPQLPSPAPLRSPPHSSAQTQGTALILRYVLLRYMRLEAHVRARYA